MGWRDSISNALGNGPGSLGSRLGNTNRGTQYSGSSGYQGAPYDVSSRGGITSTGRWRLNPDGSYTKLPATMSNTRDGATSSPVGMPNTRDGTRAGRRSTPVVAPKPAAAPAPKPAAKPVKPAGPTAEEKAAADAAAKAKLGRQQGSALKTYTGDLTRDINDAFALENVQTGDYQSEIDKAIEDALRGIKPTTDYSAYAKPDIGETLLSDIRTGTINKYEDKLASKYGSGNYASDLFPSTRDDPILNSILSPQRTEAEAALKRAFDRGTLGQPGYDAALEGIAGQGTAGLASLQGTGGGIMEGYRTDINDLISGANAKAGAWDFGSGWTPQDAISGINKAGADYGGRLEGDIRGAVGDKQFFNWNDLVRKGGMEQGLYNPATDTTGGGGSSLAAAIADRTKRENTKRGLGTQGTF